MQNLLNLLLLLFLFALYPLLQALPWRTQENNLNNFEGSSDLVNLEYHMGPVLASLSTFISFGMAIGTLTTKTLLEISFSHSLLLLLLLVLLLVLLSPTGGRPSSSILTKLA